MDIYLIAVLQNKNKKWVLFLFCFVVVVFSFSGVLLGPKQPMFLLLLLSLFCSYVVRRHMFICLFVFLSVHV